MALPSDIKLPAGARYYQFVEKDLKFNSNYDIVWSFQFRVPGDLGHTGATLPSQDYEYAFGTFLTTLTSEISSVPGQYVGDSDPEVTEARDEILTETDVSILTEEGEKYIYDAFKELKCNKTIILVTHRLSTLKNADIIYFIKNGILSETGKYDELINNKGDFYELINSN